MVILLGMYFNCLLSIVRFGIILFKNYLLLDSNLIDYV